MKKPLKTPITEIFSSIQGEGVYLGFRQVFIRFAGCNMSCAYCDEKKKTAIINVTPESLLKKTLFFLDKTQHHSVSLTGGEPLLHEEFLAAFLPLLRKQKLPVYLETNGTLPEKLQKLLKYFDIIAMDIKLPSSGTAPAWKKHEKFLGLAKQKDVFIKTVVNSKTESRDLLKAAKLVSAVNKYIPFIIQPSPGFIGAMKMQATVLKHLHNVRVIPQTHKITGVK